MEKSNITRQVKDIISQADNLRNSTNFEVDAKNFSKYNDEMKAFLLANFSDEMVRERVEKIPFINYKAVQHKIWYWLFLPVEFIYLYQRYIAKQMCLRDVEDAKNLYSSILMLIKNN